MHDSSVFLAPEPIDTGLEVIDLQTNTAFQRRTLHARHLATPIEGIQRLGRALIDAPGTILQELVQAAIDLCGADSAGISMERPGATDEAYYEWVATAGNYEKFLNAMLPRVPSACSVCLERGRPQLLRVAKSFFDGMGLVALEVTDGILLPWQVDEQRGTIWILAHGRREAFDQDDYRIMHILADVAALGIRQQSRYSMPMKLRQNHSTSRPGWERDLGRKFENTLHSLKNILHMVEQADKSEKGTAVTARIKERLIELSLLVNDLLKVPEATSRPN